MYAGSHPQQTSLKMDNVIAFPQRAESAVEGGFAGTGQAQENNVTLLRLWDRAGDQDGLDGVSPEIIQRLREMDETGHYGALCVLRLNEYRLIEETFGQPIRKRLAEMVGKRLRSGMRGNDLLEQVSEDEFVLIFQGQADNERLERISRRLLNDCSGTYTLDGLRMHLSANLGIARFPQDAAEPSLLMRYARIALHETRPGSPTPYHFFTQNLLKELQNRVWMAAEIEQALVDDRFELHYQPLFDVKNQQILGAEALLRLRTEAGELIAPDRFIPLAEEMGLIAPVGRWVMREACEQLSRWHQQGHTQLRMAVNVSPVQLLDEHFVQMVCGAVEAAGIAYSDLELEITESRVVEYLPLIEQAFSELTAKGVQIAIDDFGTGYSALAYLTRLHWSRVKIDRAFLADIPHEANAGRVVSAIIAMAGELGLQVTAEGVETEAQFRFLQAAGCQSGQGFGYARPQRAKEFMRSLQNQEQMGWTDDTLKSVAHENCHETYPDSVRSGHPL